MEALLLILAGLVLFYGISQPLLKPALTDDGHSVTPALIGLLVCLLSGVVCLITGFAVAIVHFHF
jgi:hypothetical protein